MAPPRWTLACITTNSLFISDNWDGGFEGSLAGLAGRRSLSLVGSDYRSFDDPGSHWAVQLICCVWAKAVGTLGAVLTVAVVFLAVVGTPLCVSAGSLVVKS